MPLEIVVGAVVGAAATGAVSSPPIRQKLRRGVVYGLAGLLVAYDHVSAMAHGVVKGARHAVSTPTHEEPAAPADSAAPAPAAPPAATVPPG